MQNKIFIQVLDLWIQLIVDWGAVRGTVLPSFLASCVRSFLTAFVCPLVTPCRPLPLSWNHRRVTDIQLPSCIPIPLQHLLQRKESSLAPKLKHKMSWGHISIKMCREWWWWTELSTADGWLPVVFSRTLYWGQSYLRFLLMTWTQGSNGCSVCL